MAERVLVTTFIDTKKTFSDTGGSPFVARKEDQIEAALGLASSISSVRVRHHPDLTPVEEVNLEKKFERISSDHGRSMTEIASSKHLIWGGKLPGDIYGARTIKGTAMYQRIRFSGSDFGEYKIRGFGLLDNSCLERVKRASRVMRANGLPTERPRTIRKLNEVLITPSWVDHVWEKMPVKIWEENSLTYNTMLSTDDVRFYLDNTDFVALERDVQVDERIENVGELANDMLKLQSFMEPIFKWLNIVLELKKGSIMPGGPKTEKFSTSKNDILRYFSDFLPSQMGTYLGRFHRIGLGHHFLHPGNWSAVGTVYDLDSVTGKKVSFVDDRPGPKDRMRDFEFALESVQLCIRRIENYGRYGENLTNKASYNFLVNYIKERYGAINKVSLLRFRSEIFLAGYKGEVAKEIFELFREKLENYHE